MAVSNLNGLSMEGETAFQSSQGLQTAFKGRATIEWPSFLLWWPAFLLCPPLIAFDGHLADHRAATDACFENVFFFVFQCFVAFLLRFACLFSLILVYCRARGSSTTIANTRGVGRRQIRELRPCNGCHKGLHLVFFLFLLFEFLARLVVNNFVLLFLADRVRRNKGMHYLSFIVVDEAK